MLTRFLSRKFLVTLLVSGLTSVLPVVYSKTGVPEGIVYAVLTILGGVGVAYGVVNVKDATLDKREDKPQ